MSKPDLSPHEILQLPEVKETVKAAKAAFPQLDEYLIHMAAVFDYRHPNYQAEQAKPKTGSERRKLARQDAAKQRPAPTDNVLNNVQILPPIEESSTDIAEEPDAPESPTQAEDGGGQQAEVDAGPAEDIQSQEPQGSL